MWRLKPTTICYCVFKIKGHFQIKKNTKDKSNSTEIVYSSTSLLQLKSIMISYTLDYDRLCTSKPCTTH